MKAQSNRRIRETPNKEEECGDRTISHYVSED
jgi:hypothetical protein